MTLVEPSIPSSSGVDSSGGPMACAWISLTLEEQLANFKRILLEGGPFFYGKWSKSIPIVVKEMRIDPFVDIGRLIPHDVDKRRIFQGATPLHCAVMMDDRAMVRYILTSKKVDINAEMSYRGETALNIAIIGGNHSIVEDLLEHKADVSISNIWGINALYYMIQHKKSMFDALKMFLANNVNMCDETNNTALHYAAREGAIDVVTYLLDKKAEINMYNEDGWTPLHYAVKKGSLDVVKCLLQQNANANALDGCGRSPLHITAMNGATNIISFLVEHNANVEALDIDGLSPLLHSIYYKKVDTSNRLIALGANVHVKDKEDNNALHFAIEAFDDNMMDIIKVLQECDVDAKNANAKNSKGYSPFFMAVAKGHTKVVQELLQNKEKIKLMEECNGQTTIQIACDYGYEHIKRTLMECNDVSQYVGDLYRNREVYVDAANAILVGAALIASVTFASWLQPPLGYTTSYLDLAPSSSDINYVDVQHNVPLRAFWIFNTLSFYFAIATVVFGARSVLPRRRLFIKAIVVKLHQNLLVTSIFLACSVFFVIIAFGIAGCIVLTPTLKFQWYMIVPTIFGGLLCLISLGFLFKTMLEDNLEKKKETSPLLFLSLSHNTTRKWEYK